MELIHLLMTIDASARRRFAFAALLGAVAAASSVILLALSGWFIVASAVAGAAGGAVVFNYLFPSAGVRGAAFTRVLGKYGEQLAGHDAILTLSARLRSMLFERIARSAPGATAPGAEELSLIADHVEAVEGAFLRVILPAIATFTAALIAVIIAARIDALAAITLASAIGFSGIAGPIFAFRTGRAREQANAHLNDEMRRLLSDYADGAAELIAYGAGAHATGEILNVSAQAIEARQRIETPHQLQSAATLGLGFILAVFVLWRGQEAGATAALGAGASLAALAALQATSLMTQAFDALARADEAAQRLGRTLSAQYAITQPAEETAKNVISILPIEARNVAASPAPGVVLAPVSFEVRSGEVIELSGRSGAGKTTLLETVMKLRDPVGGALTFAGADWRDVRAAAIRRRIGYAPQTPSFLAGDVVENLRLAAPDADESAIMAALSTAHVDQVITDAPAGLSTRLHNGGGFSGGELRRLGIARALLASPELLILDEPFAGLDADAADALARNLVEWRKRTGAAIIFISHQPNDAMPADRIIQIGMRK